MLPILLCAMAVIVVCTWVMFSMKNHNIEQVGMDKAKALADQVKSLRTFYTAHVVTRAKNAGMQINYDWLQHDGTLPLPATFTNVLGKAIEKENPGTRIRLFSRFPFPHREATESYDSFEQAALTTVEREPTTPFYRFEMVDGRYSIRYAVADIMRDACVDCHNTHPETPKNDWKVGDVRGIIEVTSTVDAITSDFQAGTMWLLFIVAAGLALVVTVSRIAFKRPIQEVVHVLSSTSTQIASTVAEQDRMASLQSGSVQDTTLIMEELKTSSMKVAEQSETAASGAQTASALVERGALAIQDIMKSMNDVQHKVETIASQIEQLHEQSGQIESIVKLVTDLVSQTNQLSLNAAIEAVRAGEHGKEFAVVADGIRRLADQSNASAEKIQSLVGKIQKNTTETVQSTREGTSTVKATALLAHSAAESFAGVQTAVTKAMECALQISLDVKQQASVIKPAVDAMEAVTAGAKETATGLHETKLGIQTIKETADRLETMV
ncbi:MAG: methyl-accepting chemotaxis protein [Nitrospirales bacterium]